MQEDDPRRDLLATVITQWRQVWSRTDCASMRFKLNRIGAFAEGAVTRLKWGDHGRCLLARQAPNILINGNPVLVVWDEQGRPWFECPACGRRVTLTL